jgi:hypothetical protein
MNKLKIFLYLIIVNYCLNNQTFCANKERQQQNFRRLHKIKAITEPQFSEELKSFFKSTGINTGNNSFQFSLVSAFREFEPEFFHSLSTLPGNRVLHIAFACQTGWRPQNRLEQTLLERHLEKGILSRIVRNFREQGFATERLSDELLYFIPSELLTFAPQGGIRQLQIQVQWQDVADENVGDNFSAMRNADFYLSAVFIIGNKTLKGN